MFICIRDRTFHLVWHLGISKTYYTVIIHTISISTKIPLSTVTMVQISGHQTIADNRLMLTCVH